MKQYTHAWLALKAGELLRSYCQNFSEERKKHAERLVEFMSRYPSTFVRGAWFPDTVIGDNLQGGHTWKYKLDSDDGKVENRRPPSHNKCLGFVETELGQKVKLNVGISDLPDRCEALSQTIRDAILITNTVISGDVIAFNDSQVAILFLMLAHYVCDAHVPLHCDSRDLYDPSEVHPDLETFWEEEITKYYKVSKARQQFDLDAEQNLQRNASQEGFENSFLNKCDDILRQSAWDNMGRTERNWQVFLGSGNRNLWDYLVSVCLVSFHMSLKMFPLTPPAGVDYKTVRIMEVSPFKESLELYSPAILADAINSVALVWLATWERWELLKSYKIAVGEAPKSLQAKQA
jgi:hypothetical protein